MKTHVKFIEIGHKLRTIIDEEIDLTCGCGLPAVGDCVNLYDKRPDETYGITRQFSIVERHWNVGNVIGQIEIYVVPTSEQARAII